ncbi:MAG: hypothetical protein GXO23_04835 [Crenarchaeota archaeon]|nr:hypothetical protein [Thermoproteota archaeon]
MSTTLDKHVLYLILEAIQKGATSDRKLTTRLSGLSRDLIEKTLREAEKQGLIEVEEHGHVIKRRILKLTDKGKETLEQLRREVLTQVQKSLEETKRLITEGKHEEAKQKARELKHVASSLAALGLLQEMVQDTLLLTFLSDTLGIPILFAQDITDDVDDLENVEDVF